MSTATAKKATTKKLDTLNMSEIEEGDIFSEQSHYVFDTITNTGKYKFLHLESGKTIYLDNKYVSELLKTADQYDTEVEVGLEDKKWTKKQIQELDPGTYSELPREGDVRLKGILTIWNDINSQQVFTVNFNKVATETSDKKVQEAKDKQLQEALASIAAAQKAKKGVATAAATAIKMIQDNPVASITKGEERTLRGYKTDFSSVNGIYGVVDMDIAADAKTSHSAKRQVNVRGINWLVYNGVKYIVK